MKRTVLCVAKNRETKEVLAKMGAKVAGIHSEAAISDSELSALGKVAAHPHPSKGPFRILCIGELRALKGGHFVLEALGRLKCEGERSLECVFLGDGPERGRLERLAIRYGVSEWVQFAGKVPRSKVLEYLGEADILLHPTLHDSGGWTCLEAMGASVPVISLDVGGPAMQVDARCGVLIHPQSAEQIIEEIGLQLIRLMNDPETLVEMGKAARERVAAGYVWDRVVGDFLTFYEQALSL